MLYEEKKEYHILKMIAAYIGILIIAVLLFFLANKAFAARFEMLTPDNAKVEDINKEISVSTIVDFNVVEEKEIITLKQLQDMIDRNNEYIRALQDRNIELQQDYDFIKKTFNLKVRGPK